MGRGDLPKQGADGEEAPVLRPEMGTTIVVEEVRPDRVAEGVLDPDVLMALVEPERAERERIARDEAGEWPTLVGGGLGRLSSGSASSSLSSSSSSSLSSSWAPSSTPVGIAIPSYRRRFWFRFGLGLWGLAAVMVGFAAVRWGWRGEVEGVLGAPLLSLPSASSSLILPLVDSGIVPDGGDGDAGVLPGSFAGAIGISASSTKMTIVMEKPVGMVADAGSVETPLPSGKPLLGPPLMFPGGDQPAF